MRMSGEEAGHGRGQVLSSRKKSLRGCTRRSPRMTKELAGKSEWKAGSVCPAGKAEAAFNGTESSLKASITANWKSVLKLSDIKVTSPLSDISESLCQSAISSANYMVHELSVEIACCMVALSWIFGKVYLFLSFQFA